MLISSQYVDGDLDLVNKNFLYLRSIFRAIRRAEDVVDPEKTPKLHILAEIGLSVLDALKHDNIKLSRAPGLVLLPSSLYRTLETRENNEDSCFPVEFLVNEDFLKKLVQVFECDFIQLSSSTVKRSRKYQDVLDLPMYKQVEVSKNVTIEKKIAEKEMASACVLDACSKGREQSAIAQSSLGAQQLQDGSSVIEEVGADDSEDIACLRANGHQSDSGTASLELFEIESDISTQKVDVSLTVSSMEERKRKSSYDSTESLDHCETNIRQGCSSDVSLQGSTVSFSQLRSPKKRCSSKIGNRIVSVSVEGHAKMQGSGTSLRKILLDRTNSLSVNGLLKHCQPKKSCLGLKASQDTSGSDVSHENKDAIAFRTRKRKV